MVRTLARTAVCVASAALLVAVTAAPAVDRSGNSSPLSNAVTSPFQEC